MHYEYSRLELLLVVWGFLYDRERNFRLRLQTTVLLTSTPIAQRNFIAVCMFLSTQDIATTKKSIRPPPPV